MATPPRPKPALQERSEAKLKAVLTAASELLAERDVNELSVSEIAARAGVAVGTVYRRFENRHVLVSVLLQKLQEEQVRGLRTLLSQDRWNGVRLRERIHWIVTMLVAAADAKPGLIRAIWGHLLSGRTEDAEFARKLNAETVQLLSEWLLHCRSEMTVANPDKSTGTITASLCYSVQLAILYPFAFPLLDATQVVEQLEEAAFAALVGTKM